MTDDNPTIITMADMAVVFSVTDDYGIHRESVSVELAREDPGEVTVNERGAVEITLPASQTPPTSPPPSAPSWRPTATNSTPARWYPTKAIPETTRMTTGYPDSPNRRGGFETRPGIA